MTGQEYSLLKDGKPISWNTSGNFENLSPETEYQIVTRIIFNDEEAMPSEISKPLIITTKSIAAQAPEAPKLSGRSETSITLQAQKSLEICYFHGWNYLEMAKWQCFQRLKRKYFLSIYCPKSL